MKTPRQNFVVEYKSGRRQSKTRTNSIWGDADLKALAREVENKAPHLFNSNEASGTPEEGRDTAPDLIRSGSTDQPAGEVEAARAVMLSSDSAEAENPKPHEADHPADQPVAQVEENQPASQPRRTSKSASRNRTKHDPVHAAEPVSMDGQDDQDAQSGSAEAPISVEELAAFDAENRRLKSLLAKRLHLENLQLKKMLERFEVRRSAIIGKAHGIKVHR